MKKMIFCVLALLTLLPCAAFAQADRHDVRAGNRKFAKEKWQEAEIDYRKAVLKDSLSLAASYNLASDLYRQEDWEGAGKALERVKGVAGGHAAELHYNSGDVALQKKDYAAAVKAFRESLLLNPDDLDAKENYIYAKLMLQNQQDGGGSGNDQNQDRNDQDRNNQDQQQDQNQDQNQDQQQNQDKDDRTQDSPQGGQKISPQQAQQMLQAIQAREKQTQDKVKKEKAALLQSRQKDKNW